MAFNAAADHAISKNPEEVAVNSSKIKVKQRGPYTYRLCVFSNYQNHNTLINSTDGVYKVFNGKDDISNIAIIDIFKGKNGQAILTSLMVQISGFTYDFQNSCRSTYWLSQQEKLKH
eukprot:bmy_17145T0